MTVVIISHRIETTAQCDLLLVLANGEIADYGERDAILAGSAYRNIVLNRNEFGGDDVSVARGLERRRSRRRCSVPPPVDSGNSSTQ